MQKQLGTSIDSDCLKKPYKPYIIPSDRFRGENKDFHKLTLSVAYIRSKLTPFYSKKKN